MSAPAFRPRARAPRRAAAGLCALLLLLTARTASSQPLFEQILSSGPSSQRINLVFLAEGYRQDEHPKFVEDAGVLLSSFLGTEPFSGYASYFNAYTISVASRESGSDHPNRNVFRDTYFNSTFFSFGVDRLLTLPDYGPVFTLLEQYVPDFDVVVVIVNDEEYGGSGGTIAVTSTNPAAAEIVIHELGHSFAALADEYEDPTPGYSGHEAANSTSETRREQVRWRDWIDADTPVPTPETSAYADRIGLFEGSTYSPRGWYRPHYNCKMRSLGVPFCSVCMETLVHTLYRRVRPVIGFEPAQTVIDAAGGAPLDFTLALLGPEREPLRVAWTLDGVPVEGDERLTLPALLPPGDHELKAVVRDPTALVRTDDLRLLADSVTWTIRVPVGTGTDGEPGGPLAGALLEAGHPNPFRTALSVDYRVPEESRVEIAVYDLLGRQVARLVDGVHPAGEFSVRWTVPPPPGVYLCRLLLTPTRRGGRPLAETRKVVRVE